jgi:hypothetical protein
MVMISLILASGGTSQPAYCQPGTVGRDLLQTAREIVAQALFAASVTATEGNRAADVRFGERRGQIDRLSIQLEVVRRKGATAAAEVRVLSGQLAALQERYVGDLAARDRAYAQELAVFRNTFGGYRVHA